MNKQRGVVIVLTLFIMAIVATMAYIMLARLQRDTYRTRLILNNIQAEFYAQGSIAWAIDTLRENWLKQKPDRIIDPLPITSPENEMQGYKIQSIIYDAEARFNINNLKESQAQEAFTRLLTMLDPTLNENQIKALILAIVDWISPNDNQNKYSEYYTTLKLPYRAAHRPMVTISELNLVKGMNSKLFHLLKPYLIALPEKTVMNVQTAPPLLLAAFDSNISLDAAKIIAEARKDKPFLQPQSFSELDIVKNRGINSEKITVVSNYFLVETHVNIEQQKVVLFTLLERSTREGNAEIRLIWQSKQEDA